MPALIYSFTIPFYRKKCSMEYHPCAPRQKEKRAREARQKRGGGTSGRNETQKTLYNPYIALYILIYIPIKPLYIKTCFYCSTCSFWCCRAREPLLCPLFEGGTQNRKHGTKGTPRAPLFFRALPSLVPFSFHFSLVPPLSCSSLPPLDTKKTGLPRLIRWLWRWLRQASRHRG